MLKSLVFSLALLVRFGTFAQTSSDHFVELTYAGTGYNSLSYGSQNAWNSGFGVAVNRSLTRIVSFEMAYHNAWINETILNVNYRFIAHWTALHFGIGKDYENCSLQFLVGPSFGTRGIGADLGTRFTYQLTNHLAIHSSLFFSGFGGESGIAEVSGGAHPDPLSAFLFLNANLGLAWHFTAK